jgi:hypothetical protein
MVALTPLTVAAAVKLPHSTTRTNIDIPDSLSKIANPEVLNDPNYCIFINSSKQATLLAVQFQRCQLSRSFDAYLTF